MAQELHTAATAGEEQSQTLVLPAAGRDSELFIHWLALKLTHKVPLRHVEPVLLLSHTPSTAIRSVGQERRPPRILWCNNSFTAHLPADLSVFKVYFLHFFPQDNYKDFSTVRNKSTFGVSTLLHGVMVVMNCILSRSGRGCPERHGNGGRGSNYIDCLLILAESEQSWIHLSVDKPNCYVAVLQKEAMS